MLRTRRPRRPRRPSRQKQQDTKLNRLGFLLIAVIVIIAVVGTWYYRQLPPVVTYDNEGCPSNRPVSELVAVIVDHSDVITPIQRDKIIGELNRVKSSLNRYGEMRFYTVGSIEQKTLTSKYRACNPGSPEQINKYTEPVRKAEKRWGEFNYQFENFITGILPSGAEQTSPIIESIRSVGTTAFSLQEYDDVPKRLHIVSDMMQNSSLLSHYRVWSKCDVTASGEKCDKIHAKTGECMKMGGRHSTICKEVTEAQMDFRYWSTLLVGQLRADIDDVTVEVFYVRRNKYKGLQGAEHVNFWENYFTSNNAKTDRVLSIYP